MASYTAKVTSQDTGEVKASDLGKDAWATALAPNSDLDLDSTGQVVDKDSFIPADFGEPGDLVVAEVLDGDGVLVAAATATCDD